MDFNFSASIHANVYIYYESLQSAFASNPLPQRGRVGVGVSKAQIVPI